MLIEIRDQNVGSFSGEGDCDGAANAAVATGDDSSLTPEAIAAPLSRFAVVRSRLHGGRRAWHRLLLIWKGRRGIIHFFAPRSE